MRPSASGLILALAVMAVSACTTTPPMSDPMPSQARSCTTDAATGSKLQRRCPSPEAATPMPPPTESCNADAAKPGAMGKVASADVVERARKDAGARMARVLKPGQMVTMEYAEGRLNIDVDAHNVVINLRCG